MPQPKKSGSSGRKPASADGKPGGARKPSPKPAARKQAASKPAARKPAASKPATRKQASAKPAARKPAASNPARKPGAQRGRGAASGGRGSSHKPARAAAPERREDALLPSSVAAARELLTRGIMITGDRLQDTLDEAVRRGRMTAADAEELVQVLVEVGRRQTQDALAELEGLVERSAEETRRRTGSRVRSVAAAARRVPGTDRALRTVDRARRAAGLGSAFPIIGYDELTAAQVIDRLSELTPAELRKVRDHERRNAQRKSILGAIDKRLT